MKNDITRIIRLWKDETYRKSLSPEEQALLPENPVGELDLSEAELAQVTGGMLGTSASGACFSIADCITIPGYCEV